MSTITVFFYFEQTKNRKHKPAVETIRTIF
nr:MAG TPA: hypothetical protein [Caudoviricetes sp.]